VDTPPKPARSTDAQIKALNVSMAKNQLKKRGLDVVEGVAKLGQEGLDLLDMGASLPGMALGETAYALRRVGSMIPGQSLKGETPAQSRAYADQATEQLSSPFAKFGRAVAPPKEAPYSSGVAQVMGKGIGKVAKEEEHAEDTDTEHDQLAKVDDEGVTFKSHRDGSSHRFTPERSIQIQHNIGADIIVAFDECTSPHEPHEKQKISLDRTHAWAIRSLAEHKRLLSESVTKTVGTIPAALYGVVQGGKYQDLREEAARTIGAMDFDGFGIGG
jgi:hypothetical protein